MYCGSSAAEKGRFLLTLFDTGGRGLLSVEEIHKLIYVSLESLGRCSHVTIKPKEIRVLVDDFVGELMEPSSPAYGFEATAKSLTDTRVTSGDSWREERILGLVEMQELARFCENII